MSYFVLLSGMKLVGLVFGASLALNELKLYSLCDYSVYRTSLALLELDLESTKPFCSVGFLMVVTLVLRCLEELSLLFYKTKPVS